MVETRQYVRPTVQVACKHSQPNPENCLLSQVLSRGCVQTRAEHGGDERCGGHSQSCRVQPSRAKGQSSRARCELTMMSMLGHFFSCFYLSFFLETQSLNVTKMHNCRICATVTWLRVQISWFFQTTSKLRYTGRKCCEWDRKPVQFTVGSLNVRVRVRLMKCAYLVPFACGSAGADKRVAAAHVGSWIARWDPFMVEVSHHKILFHSRVHDTAKRRNFSELKTDLNSKRRRRKVERMCCLPVPEVD